MDVDVLGIILVTLFSIVECGPLSGLDLKDIDFKKVLKSPHERNEVCLNICDFKEWSEWTNCTATCGGGNQWRRRYLCCPKNETVNGCYRHCQKKCCQEHNKKDSKCNRFKQCKFEPISHWESQECNTRCYNGGSYLGVDKNCGCRNGFEGACCEIEKEQSLEAFLELNIKRQGERTTHHRHRHDHRQRQRNGNG
ncbi:unnamed protein product [Owenia fusiformis]|uniref:Uncharacterized protein n=1 Tax=Owenia fusiformis TaxID=6347 RepID=A0A8J1TI33_OWEFU|nr:unnamed protein product [Owenia fusiformis]